MLHGAADLSWLPPFSYRVHLANLLIFMGYSIRSEHFWLVYKYPRL